MRLQYHTRNIQRIEGVLRQPGVLLALRMAAAVDANPGEFFEALFEEAASAVRNGASSAHKRASVMYQPPGSVDGMKSFLRAIAGSGTAGSRHVANRHGKKRGL